MQRKTKILSGVAAAVLVAGGAGVAAATTSATDTPPSSTTASSTAKPHAKHKASLAAKVQHGEVTMNGKKHRVMDLQKGTVSAVSPTSITVRSEDGFSGTYALNQDTKVRQVKQKKSGALTDLHNGDTVRITATKSGSTSTATRIADSGAPK